MYYVGQKLKNSQCDNEPSFKIIKIFKHLNGEETYYRVKNLFDEKIQVTTEEFLYPHN